MYIYQLTNWLSCIYY